jgi:hypothetical protein
MPPATRTGTILGRFPRHLEADGPGKLFGAVVATLAGALDVQTDQVGRLRRAHRLGHADEHTDLLGLAALHGLREQDFATLELRLAAVRSLAATLADAGAAPADVTAALKALTTRIGLPEDVFPRFPAEGADPAPARARLAAALSALGHYDSELDLLRARIRAIVDLHRAGNGTVGALLGASAAQLDLELESVRHLASPYWHVARCRDRLRLRRPEPPGARPPATIPLPAVDLIALEENPPRAKKIEPIERKHTECFHVLRAGFDPVPATVVVLGEADRTVHPMVVNRDTGHGLAWHGTLGDGQVLRFQTDGSVLLDGSDASRQAWSFQGAVFADGAAPAVGRDFVYADAGGAGDSDRTARYPVTRPPDALDPAAVWPHAADTFSPEILGVGETRCAFFVRVGHFGSLDGGSPAAAVPASAAAKFDGSVYAFVTPPEAVLAAGRVGFEWLEREAYAARVWIPQRFQALDVAGQAPVRERVRMGLERHRAAGIHVYVEYASDLWTLGDGVLRDLDGSDDPEGLIVNGTRLWPDGAPQPS